MSKVIYKGVHPEVRFMGMVFERGKKYDMDSTSKITFPIDFEVDGKVSKPKKKYTLELLRLKEMDLGWKEFQRWAKKEFGVMDTDKEELFAEVLKKQGDLIG